MVRLPAAGSMFVVFCTSDATLGSNRRLVGWDESGGGKGLSIIPVGWTADGGPSVVLRPGADIHFVQINHPGPGRDKIGRQTNLHLIPCQGQLNRIPALEHLLQGKTVPLPC